MGEAQGSIGTEKQSEVERVQLEDKHILKKKKKHSQASKVL